VSTEEPTPPVDPTESKQAPATEDPTTAQGPPLRLPLVLLSGALLFALVSAGSFLLVPRLLDWGDPSSPSPTRQAP